MADARRLIELGMVPELAAELVSQINAAVAGVTVPATAVTVAAVDEANFEFAGGNLQEFADAIGAAIPAA
ncbi:hypothetical protein [Sphingopyxis sp. 113P3]|uniref:hypothetical protein n=1 Tax=Sphingopyxis sp. (strain 113P3) TaxID=292913 RepID=UPI0006AD4C71|nr:hypothetical protein [Sphingopyxis sp. 113P3]ALC11223.1 hypothetical protein LH20_04580 [Sphingopyxis sp. 113P3]